MVDIGQKPPNFSIQRDGGATVSLADFAGKKLVLFFYPKDDTPGCTIESIEFTQKSDEFAAANTVVMGVSKDSLESHAQFILKHDLNVPLLSDNDGALCTYFDVWKEKIIEGQKIMRIERSTFLIDEQGHVSDIWRDVAVPGHVQEVLERVQQA